MAGQFTALNRPLRPGAYFDFEAQAPEPRLISANAVVALPFVHPWGPENKVVALNEWGDFLRFYSQGGTTPPTYTAGYKAVRQAFTGEGVPGRAGAGQVLAYRIVGTGAVASSTIVNNTTPAAALTVTAVYKGTYGDKISVANIADSDTTKADFQVYVEGALTETFVYTKTDIASLAALINDPKSGSKWVTAVETITGTALATITTPVALASGNDGASPASGDWTTMMTALGVARFTVFAPWDLTDSSILASVLAWGQGLNSTGHRVMFVTGGGSSDTASTATTRAAALNDPDFLTVGVGTYNDATLGSLTTSQLAPRLAGIIAARNESQGLSFARLAGLSIVSGASNSDILTGIQQGFITISQDSNAISPVRFEKGVTTYTTATDVNKPVGVFGNPKFVRTMELLEMELTEYYESNVIGLQPQDPKTVELVLGQTVKRLKQRELDRILLAGWTVFQQTNPPPQPTDDFVWLVYTIQFTRDTEQVLGTVIVG